MKKEKNFNYKLIRTLAVPVFKICLKPKIINSKVIPEEGPLLLCGNHLHVWDQFPVICSTKRVTHWMAKKEYFDGKMGSLFRATGAICVDRFGDSEKSVEEALHYLKIGSAVGLFPEGTRNQYEVMRIKIENLKNNMLKMELYFKNGQISLNEYNKKCIELEEKYNQCLLELEQAKKTIELKGNKVIEGEELLPFKFGAVSMAKKTNATIVPFGVTGDYTIGNDNLIVNFGKPFKVGNRGLEEANNELRCKVLNLVRENRKKM